MKAVEDGVKQSPTQVDVLIEQARVALPRIFKVPGLSDTERLATAKKLNEAVLTAEFSQQRSTLVAGPSEVELPVAGKCNLRCTMCSLSHGAPTYPHWTKEEVARFDPLLRYASSVNPTGVGEPLTNRDFFPMLEHFRDLQLTTGFYTNGTQLDAAKIERLIDLQVTQVNISLDGATASTFEAIRKNARFDQVVEGIRLLVARRKKRLASRPAVQIAMVLMEENVQELPALVNLAHDLGADSVYCMYVSELVPEKMCERDPVRTNRYLREARVLAKSHGLIFHAPADLKEDAAEAKEAGATVAPRAEKGRHYCAYPWFKYMVHNDGQVGPCCLIRGELDGKSFGHSAEPNPERLWNSEGMVRLRQRLAEGDPPEVCRKCTIRTLSI